MTPQSQIADAGLLAEKLRESEERLRLALAAGDVGIWDYDLATGVLIWDQRCRQIHGAPPETPITYELFARSVHPDDRPRVDELVRRMLDPKSGGHYVVEYRIYDLESRVERWVAVRGSVLFDDAGAAVRFIGTTLDVTAERRAAETRERLLGIVGHDLRGPLTAIKAAATLLEPRVPKASAHHMSIIARSVDRMAAMITQLLDFTRARLGGGLALDLEDVDLAELAARIVDEVALAHAGRKPRLFVDGECVLRCDRQRVGQVLANLLHNALIHGSREGPVTLRLVGEPACVRIDVHNEGPPIARELMPALFDPFRRRPQRRDHEGLGLGLYIAHEIVSAHGGDIDVVSSEGIGTTFRVRLPK